MVKKIKYNTRFEARLSEEQKALYQRASEIGGYRNLTEFVIDALQEKAKTIIDEHNALLKSEKDWEIFVDTLLHPPKPNKNMKATVKEYKKLTGNK